jgi:predicted enzyme related to lactoylglutathione lyase
MDHIGLGVRDLDAVLSGLKRNGVKVLQPPAKFGNSEARAAMIEGPDAVAIELVELK